MATMRRGLGKAADILLVSLPRVFHSRTEFAEVVESDQRIPAVVSCADSRTGCHGSRAGGAATPVTCNCVDQGLLAGPLNLRQKRDSFSSATRLQKTAASRGSMRASSRGRPLRVLSSLI